MNSHLARLALSDEGFLFDPQTGDSFQLSETGIIVLRELKEGHSDDAIAQCLAETYDVTVEEARRDCADFRSRLQQFGLA